VVGAALASIARFDLAEHSEALAQRRLETKPLDLHCLPPRAAPPKVQWDHQARSAPPWPVSPAALRQRFDPAEHSEGLAQHLETTPLDLHCLPQRVAPPKVQRRPLARSAKL
jgi:hypothetical protein